MQGYWPTAGDAPDASAHTKSHARWCSGVKKMVASRTLPASKDPNVRVVADGIVGALRAEKQKAGGDIMIFGSPTLTRVLAAADLVDQWRLTLQPVILGGGLPLFDKRDDRVKLELRSSKTFASVSSPPDYATEALTRHSPPSVSVMDEKRVSPCRYQLALG